MAHAEPAIPAASSLDDVARHENLVDLPRKGWDVCSKRTQLPRSGQDDTPVPVAGDGIRTSTLVSLSVSSLNL